MAKRNRTKEAGFSKAVTRTAKRKSGRTATAQTPLNVRVSGVQIDDITRERMNRRMARQLGKFALHIERITLRMDDINGPRGGVDKNCRIKVVLSGLPSVVVQEKNSQLEAAFSSALKSAERSVRRNLEKAKKNSPRRKKGGGAASEAKPAQREKPPSAKRGSATEEGSIIGRRVGRAAVNLAAAADRPEKRSRDVPVDTAKPGRSASDRKVGKGATAKRNTKLNTAGLTSTLEDSAKDRPSRKSTRRSANRSKRDSNLRRRQTRRVSSPKSRARRG